MHQESRQQLLAAAVLVLALLGVVAVGSAVANNDTKLAKLLAERDPGARVGGNTIVGTGASDDLYGVPDRINFIVALGSLETIHGGAAGDELGALGSHVTIIAPAAGHASVVGGPVSTIIVGGKGHDVVVDHKAGAKIKIMSPGNDVIATGLRDRVICGPHVHDETITLGRTDTVSAGCRGHQDTIKHSASSHSAATAHAAVTGSGSNSNPFTEECPAGSGTGCVITFKARTLSGFWANEFVPAYRCPASHPYLEIVTQGIPGIPVGVIVTKTGASAPDVRITGLSTQNGLATGTLTDFPNSSATNWSNGTVDYSIGLRCTSNQARAYPA